ncbi:NAD(P)H-dependent glycerol-3-phosphate dehydrogenase [Micrococcoides hystricis]|uniref:Glycerol-3-phosphate dehydrogenase [NAD(P)+] n=1 Tax=Micrococcoides hystricis TaxID=1572761 RepID=A0ABV6PC40_9MICC
MTVTKIAVLGAGSWGTTFAKVLADCAADTDAETVITLWARRAEVAESINDEHLNPAYTRDIRLPASIQATTELLEAVRDADMIVLAVPAQGLRPHLTQIKDELKPGVLVVSLIKGLERETGLRMSEVIAEELVIAEDQVVVVSGPNLAMEIARQEPTASVVACTNEDNAKKVVSYCNPSYFRPYTNTDVIGVEMGGVVKNVIALAVGMCDGQNLGDNSKASVITRGLAETTRLALKLGGRAETLAGLAGLGDLVATCASPLSRNRTAGRMLGQGKTVLEIQTEMKQVAEGMKSAKAVTQVARSNGVEMPICEAVVRVLEDRLVVKDMANLLLSRDLKAEVRP